MEITFLGGGGGRTFFCECNSLLFMELTIITYHVIGGAVGIDTNRP